MAQVCPLVQKVPVVEEDLEALRAAVALVHELLAERVLLLLRLSWQRQSLTLWLPESSN